MCFAFAHAHMQFVKGDIQSMDLLGFVLSSEEVDTVMHFAAQVGHHNEICYV